MIKIDLGAVTRARLKKIESEMVDKTVTIGFQDGARYPDGTLAAAVAFTNEFGRSPKQPPRPFFRRMITKESSTWGPKIAAIMKSGNLNSNRVLGLMGEDIVGALKQSIRDLREPRLSQYTIDKKGHDKPLVDSGFMLKDTITYEVKENE